MRDYGQGYADGKRKTHDELRWWHPGQPRPRLRVRRVYHGPRGRPDGAGHPRGRETRRH